MGKVYFPIFAAFTVGNIGFRSAQRMFNLILPVAACWLTRIVFSTVAQRLDGCQCCKSKGEHSAGLLHRYLCPIWWTQRSFPGSPILVSVLRVLV